MDIKTDSSKTLKLFMMLLGCKPKGRHTEQHDIFFGIGYTPKDLIPEIIDFWPEAEDNIHIDAWRAVTSVDGYSIMVTGKEHAVAQSNYLFFVNLGGYTQNVFDEQHYKLITVKPDKASAKAEAKQTLFYQQTHFPGTSSHIDDHYGIDVDDLYPIEDALSPKQKEKYSILITKRDDLLEDEIHLGYFQLSKLQ